MRKQKFLLSVLCIAFVLGLGLVTTGLASLPPPYETAKTIILNPNLEKIIKDLKPENMVDDDTIATGQKDKEPEPEDNTHLYTIKRGDTVPKILQNFGVDSVEAAEVTGELDDHFKLRQLKAGEKLNIELFDDKTGKHVKFIKFKPSITKLIELEANEKGGFTVNVKESKLQKILLKARGNIVGSFYQSAVNAGVTPAVVSQLIAALSYDLDFQRDIQAGNKFTILFEGMVTENSEFIKSTRPYYVKVEMRKKTVEIYIVQKSDGTFGYFHADGSNVKKALLRTPIDGARITSSFGMRFHPILGYTKMHKGVDFGAPTGTPIYAAGDGVIESAKYTNGYGNFILLRHTATYETAYGHISRFARGISSGVKVKQGQVIAYVGATGRATGPHLHYEVRAKGTQVNPAGIKFAFDNKLSGKDLAKFQNEKKRISVALSDAPTRAELADLIKEEDEEKLDADTEEQEVKPVTPTPVTQNNTAPAPITTPAVVTKTKTR